MGTMVLNFWNGNRSEERQDYERKVLITLLEATEPEWGGWEIQEHLDTYPGDEESRAFTHKGHDVLVTVAGNLKFEGQKLHIIPDPLTRNLLGYRIPVIRKSDAHLFRNIEQIEELRKLTHGIPETWSDAEIFRQNGFKVAEEGTIDSIFDLLESGRFDYTALGANEILSMCSNLHETHPDLMIEPSLMLCYPIPLVFYVHPDQHEIANRIEVGMKRISISGDLDDLFKAHYGDIPEKLSLRNRKTFTLENPIVPEACRSAMPETGEI